MPTVPAIRVEAPAERSVADTGQKSTFTAPSKKVGITSKRKQVSFAAVDRNPGPTTTHSVPRRKIALKPHHSAIDWEDDKKKKDMRQIDPSNFPMRVSKAQLSQHKHQGDYWMALGGKVYNITNYLEFHPGGKSILTANSGQDATAIFNRYHRWVNYERILDACFIGFLV